MNFVTLTGGGGTKFRLNLDHVAQYERDDEPSEETMTYLLLVNGSCLWCKETPEFLDGFISGHAAFTNHVPGSTFHDTKPEQDSRTKLLIDVLNAIDNGATAPQWGLLRLLICTEVGEAAVEQYPGGALR
jgi:hypothetical protein